MRIAVLLAATAAVGCASSTSSDPAGRERIQHVDEDVRLTNRSAPRADTIPASPLATMRAVVETYRDLEIPVTRAVDAERRLETRDVRMSRIAGERMSRFLDCGRGITGQRADNHVVIVTLETSVLPTDDGRSRVVTDFDATARPRDTSGSEIYCSSRGTLEVLLFDGIRERAGAGRGPMPP